MGHTIQIKMKWKCALNDVNCAKLSSSLTFACCGEEIISSVQGNKQDWPHCTQEEYCPLLYFHPQGQDNLSYVISDQDAFEV